MQYVLTLIDRPIDPVPAGIRRYVFHFHAGIPRCRLMYLMLLFVSDVEINELPPGCRKLRYYNSLNEIVDMDHLAREIFKMTIKNCPSEVQDSYGVRLEIYDDTGFPVDMLDYFHCRS